MKVLILLGGQSAERDVSYATGIAVAKALEARGHSVAGLDPADGTWYEGSDWYANKHLIANTPPALSGAERQSRMLSTSLADSRIDNFDTVFIALHGGTGEDGTVQTLLSLTGVPFTGSGPLSSGVAMHKHTSKRLFLQSGIPTPDWLFPVENGSNPLDELELPVIVKPVAEGSTVGLSLVKDAADLPGALKQAGRHAMVESFIPGRELSVGVLGDRALPPVEIIPDHEIYDYECKYTDGMSQYKCPAPLDSDVESYILELSLRAHKVLGCEGVARVDFRLSHDYTPYCLEVNTLPGMTAHSLVPMAAQAAGMDFETLCEHICELAHQKSN